MEAGRGPGPVSSDGRSLAAKAGGVRQGGQGGGDKMKQLMDRLVHSDHTDLHNKEVNLGGNIIFRKIELGLLNSHTVALEKNIFDYI